MENRILRYIVPKKEESPAFHSTWNVWYHHNKSSWKISDYKTIFAIENINDYWDFHNNLKFLNGINSQHYFLMRDDIKPTWEDERNKTGGCWSIKLSIEKSSDLWIKLSSYIVGETLVKNHLSINGLSICTKNPTTSVIKIWNNNYKENSIQILPNDILNEYGYNIIYKANIPEY
jgi:hypothetical protein